MVSIEVYGASDDLVEIEIDGKPFEELSEPNTIKFVAADKILTVDIKHSGSRGWQLTATIDDDTEEGELPFRVRLVQHRYSPKFIIESDTALQLFWKDGHKEMVSRIVRPKAKSEGQEG